MGGCATKPRELKEEREVPKPLDQDQVEAEDPSSTVANLKVEQKEEEEEEEERTSLGNLLKESEESDENRGVSGTEGEEITEKEAITTSQVETKGEQEEEEEEQTKSQVYPTETSQIETVEASTSLPSSVPIPEAPEAEEKAVELVESVVKGVTEDSNSVKIEEKEEVFEEKEGDAELKPSSTVEKKEDGGLPSSTETTE